MPHGTPDWGLVGPKDTIYGLDDLGEHAVRLGSPHLWDRRGDVIWFTIFENGLEGALEVVSAGTCNVRLWTGYARQGAFHVHVEVEHPAAHYAALEKWLPFPVTSGIGCEFSFWDYTERGPWYIQIDAVDEAASYEGRVRVWPGTGVLQYYDATGVWVALTSGTEYILRDHTWHTMKLVIMFDLGLYNRVILDDEVYDMGALPLYAGRAPGPKYLHVVVGRMGHDTVDVWGYMDSVIVTQNEP